MSQLIMPESAAPALISSGVSSSKNEAGMVTSTVKRFSSTDMPWESSLFGSCVEVEAGSTGVLDAPAVVPGSVGSLLDFERALHALSANTRQIAHRTVIMRFLATSYIVFRTAPPRPQMNTCRAAAGQDICKAASSCDFIPSATPCGLVIRAPGHNPNTHA